MARQKNADAENKYSRPVRTYVRPYTYDKLMQFCQDINILSISFVTRRIIEIVDDYPEKKSLLLSLFEKNSN